MLMLYFPITQNAQKEGNKYDALTKCYPHYSFTC